MNMCCRLIHLFILHHSTTFCQHHQMTNIRNWGKYQSEVNFLKTKNMQTCNKTFSFCVQHHHLISCGADCKQIHMYWCYPDVTLVFCFSNLVFYVSIIWQKIYTFYENTHQTTKLHQNTIYLVDLQHLMCFSADCQE